MTHASWNNERGRPSGPGHDNERLEYLGDAVLELVVGEYLFKRFPEYDEGQLTQLRAALVNTSTLARLAERLRLGETLFVGKGAAKTGARQLPSLLANAFEAMIGAIFLDQGYRVATRVFLQNIGDLAEWSDANYKGRLQEVAQDRTGTTPSYRVAASGGPGHKREYHADAVVGGEIVGSGTGSTKQAAEQAAARDALQTLTREPKQRAAAKRAAGAAREAVRETAAEPPRGRRRVAEVAADRSIARGARMPRERPAAPPAAVTPEQVVHAAASAPRRRGLLATLRSAAEALVGRVVPPEAPELPAAEASVPVAAPQPAAPTRRRRSAAPADRMPTTPDRKPATSRPPRTRTRQSGAEAAPPARSRAPRSGPPASMPSDGEPAKPTRRGRRGGRGRRRPTPATGAPTES